MERRRMTVYLWVCVCVCARVHLCVCVCVWLTPGTVRTVCASGYEYVCPSCVLFSLTRGVPSIFYYMKQRHTNARTHIVHESGLWSVVGEVKWQVFNQCWPPHAMELICWTRLNLPFTLHLIHPLTGCGCHTQVTATRDSLTNNM